MGKFRSGFGIFFFKNPSKLKKFPRKGRGFGAKPLPEYAPVSNKIEINSTMLLSFKKIVKKIKYSKKRTNTILTVLRIIF